MRQLCQRTLRSSVKFTGIGLHSGTRSEIILRPSAANSGVVFRTPRCDVPADVRNICSTNLTTSLCSKGKQRTVIHTVEHILAALAVFKIDNVLVELPKSLAEVCVPILDGSAKDFADGLANNIAEFPETVRKRVIVRKPVLVAEKSRNCGQERHARLLPPHGGKQNCLSLDVTVDFGQRITGNGLQNAKFTLDFDSDDTGSEFRKEIAGARTFCFESDILSMKQAGLIKGGSLDNAVVFGDTRGGQCINPEGLRFDDEPCRHKLLDCIGDLSLLGCELVGRFETRRPGHELNRKILLSLLSNPDSFELCS